MEDGSKHTKNNSNNNNKNRRSTVVQTFPTNIFINKTFDRKIDNIDLKKLTMFKKIPKKATTTQAKIVMPRHRDDVFLISLRWVPFSSLIYFDTIKCKRHWYRLSVTQINDIWFLGGCLDCLKLLNYFDLFYQTISKVLDYLNIVISRKYK